MHFFVIILIGCAIGYVVDNLGIILHSTDYVLLVDGELLESPEVIYAKSSVDEIMEDLKYNGNTLPSNYKFVSMTELREDQQKIYIEYLQSQK